MNNISLFYDSYKFGHNESKWNSELQTDTWVSVSWDEYVQTIADPRYEKAKGYCYKGHMRIEMLPVSFDHGKDHVVSISTANCSHDRSEVVKFLIVSSRSVEPNNEQLLDEW